MPGMAESFSLDPDTPDTAGEVDRADGLSLSGRTDPARRGDVVRAGHHAHEEWLAAHPEIRSELDAFDRYADTLDADWTDLAYAT